jgi:hypothetical protein
MHFKLSASISTSDDLPLITDLVPSYCYPSGIIRLCRCWQPCYVAQQVLCVTLSIPKEPITRVQVEIGSRFFMSRGTQIHTAMLGRIGKARAEPLVS